MITGSAKKHSGLANFGKANPWAMASVVIAEVADRAHGAAATRNETINQLRLMLPKYTIEYGIQFKKSSPTYHFSTDDPVSCEEFLTELLERGFHIIEIKHEGVGISRLDFDRMVKSAASMLASRHLCASLRIKPEEERFRFGFAA